EGHRCKSGPRDQISPSKSKLRWTFLLCWPRQFRPCQHYVNKTGHPPTSWIDGRRSSNAANSSAFRLRSSTSRANSKSCRCGKGRGTGEAALEHAAPHSDRVKSRNRRFRIARARRFAIIELEKTRWPG